MPQSVDTKNASEMSPLYYNSKHKLELSSAKLRSLS